MTSQKKIMPALIGAVILFATAGCVSNPASSSPKEKTVSVVLTSVGSKIGVIKAVREVTGLGLREAKDLVDSAPKAVKTG